MDFRVVLTEGALPFIAVLIMVYYNKQQFNDSRAKFYKYMLITAALYGVFQVVFILLFKYIGDVVITYIFWKAMWIVAIVWWGCLYYYVFVISNNISIDKPFDVIKYDLFRKIFGILITVFAISICCLPKSDVYDYVSYNELSFLPGLMKIILPAFSITVSIMIIITMIKHKSSVNNKSCFKAILFVFFIAVTAVTLQMFFENIAFISLAFIAVCLILYSLLENPDIKLMEEINSSQGDIEKSNKTKTDFLSNMTYEIKVPMNLIMSLCEELNGMTTFDEKIFREDVAQIVSSGNSLIEIINNILDISKIETGKVVVQERDYKIKELLTDVINIAKSKIGAKQVKLMVNIDQNVSSVLNGDYSKLYQALVNIVTNAVKYTDVGRITFTLTSTKSGGIEHLLFKVSDTGTGIKEEDQPKLFEKGTRLDNASENETDGSGLGLAITKQYVESLEGKIWFDSQYRVGSSFYIDVPQKIVDSSPLGALTNEQEKETETKELLDCSKYTVLVVDDNTLNIKVAKRLLEKYKFTVESVMSGKECVYKIKEGVHYDAIFLDHMMPEMDGIETLHVLKKLEGYVLPPMVALTANAVAGMKEMYLSEGFDEYLSKPINTNELDRIVNKFFNK